MSSMKPRMVPFMQSLDDAVAISERTNDRFYVSAFKIECWLGKLASTTSAQYAEEKSASGRRLQAGDARQIFEKLFGDVTAREFPSLFIHLARFAEDNGPYGRAVREACWAVSQEAEFGPLHGLLRSNGNRGRIQLQRRFVDRLCAWLDAIAHWRIHERYYLSPISFDIDPDKRELAVVGWQQRHFSKLDSISKAYWEFHHDQAAQRFKNSDKWATVGKVMSSDATRYHMYLPLDHLVIWLWPLVKKHGWTYRDLLNVIRAITKHDRRYPCRREQELATYCNNVLGLRKGGTGKTSRDGKPEGWKVAIRLCARR
jgi:hypothetical protein